MVGTAPSASMDRRRNGPCYGRSRPVAFRNSSMAAGFASQAS
jgi:hypothetical protein